VSPAALEVRAGRRAVRITHPDKLLFPDDGIAKADLAGYYATVAPAMAPHIRDRPINLWRWNAGIAGPRIVQQEIPKGAPDWVRRVTVPKRGGGKVCHAVGGDPATLVWLANQNCITPHVWTSRADRPGRPDRLVFDLDPPDLDAFQHVRDAALALGDLLRELGLEPFAMTTGSKGVHVVAPLRRIAEADVVRATAGEIGEELAARAPDTLTTAWRKAGRGGRVLVDTARNTYAQTVVAPYAVRALPGAPVATPLAWEELEDPELHPRRWTLRTLPERLEATGDPWADIGRHAAAPPRPGAVRTGQSR
jgi:bifunctional non-homologous end joining protein LigD